MRGRSKKRFFAVLIFAASVFAGLYPFISNQMYDHRKDSVIETYREEVPEDEAENERELKKAEAFNEALVNRQVVLQDPFTKDQYREESLNFGEDEYLSLLNVNGDSVMGIITIPRIDVELPIYHGTDAETLKKGIGHLEGSSLPVGGSGSHAVLTGHTGLSSAKMFTDLIRLEEGDYFFITCLNRDIAYVVDQIRVVEPSDVSGLGIVSGQDYCTLVTCTPYGVNSHRLLVRGIRTEYRADAEAYAGEKKRPASRWMLEYRISLILCFTAAALIFLIAAVRKKMKGKKGVCEREN